MPNARKALRSDLRGLIALFRVSEVSALAAPADRLADIWEKILARDGVTVFVTDVTGGIGATCMLITAPNLLRGGRDHAFLENVVTHPDCRGQGHGQAVVDAALAEAWTAGCHHVLLQSGRQDPRVHRFYEGCGFEPGVRTSYVARRPADLA